MKCARQLFIMPAAVLALLTFGTYAAQPEAPHDEGRAKATSLDDRVKTLENRLSDLEHTMNAQSDRYYAIPRENMDDMFDRMRREIGDKGDAFSWDEFFSHGNTANNSKPHLGVILADVSAELKARFNNNVKDGAFVMRVNPGSPAERAGLIAGDAIVAFDAKAVTSPRDVSADVQNASAGPHEVTVERLGELKTFKVDLGIPKGIAMSENPKKPEGWLGWLWNEFRGNNGESLKSSTEVHVSALELSDPLSRDMKLTDLQKKKVSDILATQEKALTNEFVKKYESRPTKGSELNLSIHGDFNALVQKYADNAAKELAGVLDAKQLKQWNDTRQASSSASFVETLTLDNAQGSRASKFSSK